MTSSNTPEHIKHLARKWQEGTITNAEKQTFEAWYDSFDAIYEMKGTETREQAWERLYQNIIKKANITAGRNRTFKMWGGWLTAAAALALVFLGIYFFNTFRYQGASRRQLTSASADVLPGKNSATITLGDGRKIELSHAKNGVVIGRHNFAYSDGTPLESLSQEQKNTMLTANTPRGGTYQIVLPDGTKVWLNAESSLQFPARFNDKTREVKLSGEAYFEVAHNRTKPFKVSSKGQEVLVLGTHFNINGYDAGGVTKTTLLEGAVKITGNKDNQVLRPGQQGILEATGKINVAPANIADAIAWKNGYFIFDEETLESVMYKVARWYDLEVEYEDAEIKKQVFGGSISRYENVSKVFYMLEKAGNVKFRLEGRKVIVNKS
ncbi:transmembrane sensor [Pedobacter africanus]|uniref:Ferric-dicitrate binding protein FerR (Iron transport regulator) n=1 Tax=Pedobacter africanus TaxID=151894 RepID=A0ACC6L4S6_9SPHI|nr:FecR domain-containing protein [Pedobacter africanus]MDR6786506.1 ferric-dicitrate binding protein FerR (iron transport regulator) [Pedobacter africanus]